MGDLIKIVGVQYAVNSNHVKGEDMTAQEQQKTIEFLTMLDRKHPYVSVKPEPTNETDEEAFVARFASRKAGNDVMVGRYRDRTFQYSGIGSLFQ